MKLLGAVFGATLAFASGFWSTAQAAPIVGGQTVIAPVVALDAFDVSLLGSADAGLLFPVTGGSLDENLVGRIEHEGSGLRFARNGSTLDVENFIIDTGAGTVFGDVSANGSRVADDAALFTFALGGLTPEAITDLSNPQIGLRITETAISAFNSVLGVGFGHNTLFANAATAPQLATAQVSAPGGLALIALFGAFGALRARRKQASAA